MRASKRARRALGPLYRLRMNGAWYPGQAKVLVTRKFIDQTLNDLLEEALYVPYDRKP